MRQRATVTLSMRDLDRLKCIQAVNDGELQCSRAAERLGLTARQVRRLVLRYRQGGDRGGDISQDLMHRQSGFPPAAAA
jgi:hypothetical protein